MQVIPACDSHGQPAKATRRTLRGDSSLSFAGAVC